MRSPGRINLACLSIVVFIATETIAAYGLQPPSPELVGELTKGLSVTPQQATGGAGTLFGLAKSRLSPPDFSKVAAVVPGMGSFLKAAPSTGGGSGLSGLTGSLPGNVGGLASAATLFQKLGLSPAMLWSKSLCRFSQISFRRRAARTSRRCFLEL